jgi:hypothetical protein
MASTLVQPWSHTAASNWSIWTPRVKLSPIRLSSAIPTSPSLHHPQRIELSMAFRLLQEHLQRRHLPQVSPRWTQLPTFPDHATGLPAHTFPHFQALQACQHMNLQGCVCLRRLPPVARSCRFPLGVLLPCQLSLHCHHPPQSHLASKPCLKGLTSAMRLLQGW